MGIFKHLFWIAPVAIIAMWLTVQQQRETGAKIDVQQAQIHADVSSVLAQTATDPKMKARYMKNMSTAQSDEKAAKAVLKDRTAESDATAADFNKQMKDVDKQLKGM